MSSRPSTPNRRRAVTAVCAVLAVGALVGSGARSMPQDAAVSSAAASGTTLSETAVVDTPKVDDPARDLPVAAPASAVDLPGSSSAVPPAQPGVLPTEQSSTLPTEQPSEDARRPAVRAVAAGSAASLVTSPAPVVSQAPVTPSSALSPPSGADARRIEGVVVRAIIEAAEHDEHHDDHDDHDEIAAESGDAGHGSATWLDVDGRLLAVRSADLAGIAAGTRVSALLGASGPDGTAAAAGVQVVQDAPVAPALAAGEQKVHDVTVVMGLPPGVSSDGTTTAQVVNLVNNQVSTFWAAQTGGAVSFRVVANTGWINLATPCTNPTGLWNEAASRSGFVAGARRHLMVYLPERAGDGCSYGLATVGSNREAGGRSYVRDTSVALLIHELGHNLSLGHSDQLYCSRATDIAYRGSWGTCRTIGYNDRYDVMGISWSRVGSLSQAHADRLGVLAAQRQVVTRPTRAFLSPNGSGRGLRGLTILDPSGVRYYVEYRTAIGQDAWLSTGTNGGLSQGVVVRRQSPTVNGGTLLLDATPRTSGPDTTVTLPVGSTVAIGSGRVQLKVTGTASGYATVAVAYDGVWPTSQSAAEVRISYPTTAQTQSASETVRVSGTASAPEGALLWEIRSAGGVVVRSGSATAGANGSFGHFLIETTLPIGTWTVQVWAADESDGEGSGNGRGISSTATLLVT